MHSTDRPSGASQARRTRRAFLARVALPLAAAALVPGATLAAPSALPARAVAGRRVGLQAGHWRSAELPDELARLRGNGGTSGGVAEWQLNLDVAHRAARRLEAEGVIVDVLPATIPPGYQADAVVAIHADGDATGRLSGYKLARPSRILIPEADDHLLAAISDTYAAATGFRWDPHVSRNMTGYCAFSARRFTHATAPTTPAVILEMGFMTNRSDLTFMLNDQETLAAGISRGLYRFLAGG